MNLSLNWLNDYVNTEDIPVAELVSGLTMSGSKVEKIKKLSEGLSNIVVGKVLEINKHENSDKLWICKVQVGVDAHIDPQTVQIVTGAQNVFAGAIVPVVLDGGTVFNRQDGSVMKIKTGKLRGELSEGMLCSPDELGVDAHAGMPASPDSAVIDGIMILDDAPEIGSDMLEYLGLNDTTIEFEITNNRADCLSVIGLARETAVTFNLPLVTVLPEYKGYECNIEKEIDVVIENKRLCSRYMAGLARNVKVGESPKWLSSRLKAMGVRPINNIVDITNYVMLEYGYPLHAFDRDYVEGGQIVVRSALSKEKITLLDGNTIELSKDILVIADRMKPIAVAGVMGGEYSGVTAETKDVIFEAACFDGLSVRRASKKIGRRTESSARFEKGLDPVNVKTALLRVLQLVEELDCGEVSNTFIDYVNFSGDEAVGIVHEHEKINEILGTDIPQAEQVEIFIKLGFAYKNSTGELFPPSTRSDIKLTCDLAEEIARVYGYNKIVSTLPRLSVNTINNDFERNVRKMSNVLTAQGCYECITYSFVSPKMNAVDNLADYDIKIRNPFGEETGVMRTSLIPSMLRVISDNIKSRNTQGRFFEIGRRYFNMGSGGIEEDMLCVGLYGKDESFFTLKGVVDELLDMFGVAGELERYTEAPFHPGRAACANSKIWGGEFDEDVTPFIRFGEISPIVLQGWDISERVYIANIELDSFFKSAEVKPMYKPVPKYPAVTRDLSLVCDDETANGDVLSIINKTAELMETVEFFDIFKGGNLGQTQKCLSYKLTFRKADGTLTDEEVDKEIAEILSALENKNIKLRG
ncbi:MAG: phenylalanine--tRNA ligase subunit beta [Oscillospiraceae bacterium]|nr:phenylalanine--tRNA ligase subunit beta [Oscillospiraceae bacterium]